MATIISTNNTYVAANNSFECIWRLTRVMKKAGWTVQACSTGLAKVAPASNGTDSWGNNADPSSDVYPTAFNTQAPWIVMRGPSIVKITITAPPTGLPLRGEKILQGSAEGELIGYVYDAPSASGWMVISPRTGTFDATTTVSCAVSGASFTLSGSALTTFVREVMFAKTTDTASSYATSYGNMYYIVADLVNEDAQLYSTLATTAGCTPTVAPGAGTGTNAFPTMGVVIRGASLTTAPSTPITGGYYNGFVGSYHVACVNAISGPGVSADGSFYFIGSNSATSTILTNFLFTRVDDTDPGDCDPYVFVMPTGTSLVSYNRLANSSYGNTPAGVNSGNFFNSGYPVCVGYQARGCPVTSRDVIAPYSGAYPTGNAAPAGVAIVNYPQGLRTINHPANVPPMTRENPLIFTPGTTTGYTTIKHYKGRLRWASILSQGSILDTFDNKKYICVQSITSSTPSMVIGPWDGLTTPAP